MKIKHKSDGVATFKLVKNDLKVATPSDIYDRLYEILNANRKFWREDAPGGEYGFSAHIDCHEEAEKTLRVTEFLEKVLVREAE